MQVHVAAQSKRTAREFRRHALLSASSLLFRPRQGMATKIRAADIHRGNHASICAVEKNKLHRFERNDGKVLLLKLLSEEDT